MLTATEINARQQEREDIAIFFEEMGEPILASVVRFVAVPKAKRRPLTEQEQAWARGIVSTLHKTEK